MQCVFENSMNKGNQTERLSQEGECREISKGGILERLKQWALEHGCWFSDSNQFGDFFDRGSENEVYLSTQGTEII